MLQFGGDVLWSTFCFVIGWWHMAAFLLQFSSDVFIVRCCARKRVVCFPVVILRLCHWVYAAFVVRIRGRLLVLLRCADFSVSISGLCVFTAFHVCDACCVCLEALVIQGVSLPGPSIAELDSSSVWCAAYNADNWR